MPFGHKTGSTEQRNTASRYHKRVPRILITGASGLLGGKLLHHFAADAQGWSFRKTRPNLVSVDITDPAQVHRAFEAAGPQVCIHCAAEANVNTCEANPDYAHKLNVEGTRHLAEACRRGGAKLIFISTDYIFDGSREAYTEQDKPAPLQVYGQTKADAESIVLTDPAALVLRLPLLHGHNGPDDKMTWPREVREKLHAGLSITADDRELRQPTRIDDVAHVIGELLERELTGILHVAAQSGRTKYQWAVKIAEEAGYPAALIRASYEKPQGAKRPLRSWLSIDKLRSLGLTEPRT